MRQPPDDAPRPPPLPGAGTPADPAPPSRPSRLERQGREGPGQEGPPVLYAQPPSERPNQGALPEEPELADAGHADGTGQQAAPSSPAATDNAATAEQAAFADRADVAADRGDGGAAKGELTGRVTKASVAKTPPAPSALAMRVAALRVRIHLATEAVYVRLRWHLRELVEDLRTRDRFFRWKAAIVAGWIALSIVSLGVARSGGPAAPAANRLQAYVVIRPTTMGWGLLVHNQSRKAWRAVEIRLDGYSYRVASVAAGEQLILGPFQFERDDQILQSEHVPRSVEIAAEQGTMVLNLLD